jgi:hypothetical protein
MSKIYLVVLGQPAEWMLCMTAMASLITGRCCNGGPDLLAPPHALSWQLTAKAL